MSVEYVSVTRGILQKRKSVGRIVSALITSAPQHQESYVQVTENVSATNAIALRDGQDITVAVKTVRMVA